MQGLVTVFGGSGFVGTQVVRQLLKRGWRVRVACRKPQRAYDLQPLGNVGQIQLKRADITSRASVEAAVAGADAVINLVGILHETPFLSFQAVHVDGARHVAEAARDAGVKALVQMSAIGADAAGPSRYARSKAEGEAAVRAAFPAAVVVRPSIVFGPGDGFFNRFARLAQFAPALPLFGGGENRFQPVYVGDVALAICNALEDPAAAGRAFELGGPQTYSFRALMEMLGRETHRPRLLLPLPHIAASAIGLAGDLQSVFMAPVLTSDQALLLRRDNVVSEGAAGLEALGVEPTAVETILPTYLWRYRRGGQFAELADA
ncbi:MAG: complex I NDUFA9 subunit family protein [Caulobacteraceae bacterium]|nr:complex I NDUFA9 subunit family protein [Caulobacteraceae bacterium]